LRTNLLKAASCAVAAAVGGALIVPVALPLAASAQVDPFAAAVAKPRAPQSAPGQPAQAPAQNGPVQSNRVGFTGVEQAVGASYAGARTTGSASIAQIRMLPRFVPPIPIVCKMNTAKVLAARPKIAIPTYAIAVVRQGSIGASAMGAGSDIRQRATSISTVLIGVDDSLAAKIAEDAYADLVKQLTAAGIEVVPADQLQSNGEIARLNVAGVQARGANNWSVYAPAAAPLREGHPFDKAVLGGPKSNIVLNDVSAELDAITVTPSLALDYARYETSGRSNYTGSASAGMTLRFRVPTSGAIFINGAVKGKGGGFGGSMQCDPHGSDEAFGVLFEVDDKSDDVGFHKAFAMAGLSDMYRQSKYYGVEAVPERYAALARAAYQGFNTELVAQIVKARSK
jgi:hypothetical protein